MSTLTPIPLSSLTDFAIGHYTDPVGATGCTAIVAPKGAVGGVDVCGGAPATRETDLLRPENTVEQVHAVVLSGGSAFGLEAASGAARELEKRGIGLPVGPTCVPIVCSACLFDLALGDADARPDMHAGMTAVQHALDERDEADRQGNVGAGTGATVGKLLGEKNTMKGGLGVAAYEVGGVKVAAITAVNACGDVVDPKTGQVVAGLRPTPEARATISTLETALSQADQLTMPLDRTNTTISCIITNARLTKSAATKLAQMSADAYSHAISPTHTTNDGDAIFVMASGTAETSLPLDLMGMLATKTLEEAIVSGCAHASTLYGSIARADM